MTYCVPVTVLSFLHLLLHQVLLLFYRGIKSLVRWFDKKHLPGPEIEPNYLLMSLPKTSCSGKPFLTSLRGSDLYNRK
jgi:hypothetical protein